jgi:hypothetical protein
MISRFLPAVAACAAAVLLTAMPAGAVTLTKVDNQAWTGTPSTLTASADANLTVGTDTLDTHGSAVATWNSAVSGGVTFTNYGWDFAVFNAPSESDLTNNRGGSDWSYSFTAIDDGQITVDFAVTTTGNPFGLWGWSLNCSCGGSGGPVSNFTDPTGSGTYSGDLFAGNSYTITLDGNPNVFWNGPSGNYSGAMSGQFDWAITGTDVTADSGALNVAANSTIGPNAVPEPAAWALMIIGFAGAGAQLRLRRRLLNV